MTAYGLSSVGLRYFNAAGADPEAEVGEIRDKETHIIPLAIRAAKQNKTFRMFGDQYPTNDGSCVRDYVHVMDLADAHVKALNYATENSVAEVFNLGSGAPASNKQMLDGDIMIVAGNKCTLLAGNSQLQNEVERVTNLNAAKFIATAGVDGLYRFDSLRRSDSIDVRWSRSSALSTIY